MMQIEDITFSIDTSRIPDWSSRTTGAFNGNASFFLLDLPQVAGGILTGDWLHQVRAGLQRTAGLPQHLSPSLSETWQRRRGTQRRIVRQASRHSCVKKRRHVISHQLIEYSIKMGLSMSIFPVISYLGHSSSMLLSAAAGFERRRKKEDCLFYFCLPWILHNKIAIVRKEYNFVVINFWYNF